LYKQNKPLKTNILKASGVFLTRLQSLVSPW